MSKMIAPLIIGAMASLVAISASAGDGVHLALSGLHLAADPVRGGGDWWGIFPEGEGYTFQPVRVRVEAVINPLADGDTRTTATLITVPGDHQNITLIRGLMSAVGGPLQSLKPADNWSFLAPGDAIALSLGPNNAGGDLRIVASGNASNKDSRSNESAVFSGYTLRLLQGSGKQQHAQLLVAYPKSSEVTQGSGPALFWAGDLDRDGKTDFLYDLNMYYTQARIALFLSSAAKEGEIVGLVACWNAVSGC